MSFFNELKRRNVIRVAVAYVVLGWVLLQVADIVVPTLELPEWSMKLILVLLALGFPVALLFSWAFELTPEGLKRDKDVDRSQSVTHETAKKLDLVVIALLVVAIGMFGADRFLSKPGATNETSVAASQESTDADATPVVAVLPFSARSAGGDNDRFLADGIHDDLLTQLAQLEAFRVISRTSVMEYLGTTKNMRQIGEELGAGHILEGGLQQAGTRVRINAQLIDARTDEHLWADTFERELNPDSIFEIQSEIAQAIATALKTTLNPEQAATLAKAPTQNQAAYEAYLQGRRGTYEFSEEQRRQAVRNYENAVALDPEFDEAWGMLAFSRIWLAWQGGIQPEDQSLIDGAVQAMAKARELNPDSLMADYAEAYYHYYVEADYDKAIGLIQPIIARYPNNADYISARGWMNRRAGNWEQGTADLEKALKLDPRNKAIAFELAAFYEMTRQFDKSQAALDNALKVTGDRDQYLQAMAQLRIDCCGDLSASETLAQHMIDTGQGNNALIGVEFSKANFETALKLLDPYGPGVSEPGPDTYWHNAMELYFLMGDTERAHAEARAYQEHLFKFLETHPEADRIYRELGIAELVLGNPDKAEEYWQQWDHFRRPDSLLDGNALDERVSHYAGAGYYDQAFALLPKALEVPNGATLAAFHIPIFNEFREDPRFTELEARYGNKQ